MFGVGFLYAGSVWFLFITEVPPCEWVWTSEGCQGLFVKVSWLGKLAFVLVGGAGSLLSGVQ